MENYWLVQKENLRPIHWPMGVCVFVGDSVFLWSGLTCCDYFSFTSTPDLFRSFLSFVNYAALHTLIESYFRYLTEYMQV